MTEAIILEEFNTSMGKVVRVINDRLYVVGETVKFDKGNYKVNRIVFASCPSEENFVDLLVSKS